VSTPRLRVFVSHYNIARRYTGPVRAIRIAQAFTALLPARQTVLTWVASIVVGVLMGALPGWLS
jgi:uncharacterized membrane protein YraQ (UPF0718 family)